MIMYFCLVHRPLIILMQLAVNRRKTIHARLGFQTLLRRTGIPGGWCQRCLEFEELPLLLLGPFTVAFLTVLTCNTRRGTCPGVDEDICKELALAGSPTGPLESASATAET